MRTDQRWAIGGALGAVVLLAVSWFFLIGPQYDETASLDDQTAAAEVRVVTLQRKLVELRQQQLEKDEYQAQLVRDRQALPTEAGMADFLRQLEETGAKTGVAVTGLVVGAPTKVTGVNVQILAMPVTMIASGTSENLTRFLDHLQQVQPRAVLINSLNAVPDGFGDSLSEAVALTLSMQVFVAPPAGAPATTAPAGAPATGAGSAPAAVPTG